MLSLSLAMRGGYRRAGARSSGRKNKCGGRSPECGVGSAERRLARRCCCLLPAVHKRLRLHGPRRYTQRPCTCIHRRRGYATHHPGGARGCNPLHAGGGQRAAAAPSPGSQAPPRRHDRHRRRPGRHAVHGPLPPVRLRLPGRGPLHRLRSRPLHADPAGTHPRTGRGLRPSGSEPAETPAGFPLREGPARPHQGRAQRRPPLGRRGHGLGGLRLDRPCPGARRPPARLVQHLGWAEGTRPGHLPPLENQVQRATGTPQGQNPHPLYRRPGQDGRMGQAAPSGRLLDLLAAVFPRNLEGRRPVARLAGVAPGARADGPRPARSRLSAQGRGQNGRQGGRHAVLLLRPPEWPERPGAPRVGRISRPVWTGAWSRSTGPTTRPQPS